jgi:PHD/YefM family antitoxin component YafN of YafNO toxin-antitoxin module
LRRKSLPIDQELLKFILEQLRDTARECSDIRVAERLRMLAAEIERRADRTS